MVGWPGQHVLTAAKFTPVPAGALAGSRAGAAVYGLGNQLEVVPVKLGATLAEPSWWWRLVHG
jgi:hypothetical protein